MHDIDAAMMEQYLSFVHSQDKGNKSGQALEACDAQENERLSLGLAGVMMRIDILLRTVCLADCETRNKTAGSLRTKILQTTL